MAARQADQNFCSSTRGKPSGASPRIHNRRPSNENCGKTKRVVSVESVKAQAVRLRYEIIVLQNLLWMS